MSSRLPAPPVTSRRRLLVASGAITLGALAGCTATPSSGLPSPSGTTDPDATVRVTVAATQTALAAAYAATVRAFPKLAPTLAVGDRHVSYAAAVTATASPSATALPTSSASGLPAPATSPSTIPVPATPGAAVTALLRAERAAATQSLTQSGITVEPELTRIITLIGAGCAAAGAVLDGYGRG